MEHLVRALDVESFQLCPAITLVKLLVLPELPCVTGFCALQHLEQTCLHHSPDVRNLLEIAVASCELLDSADQAPSPNLFKGQSK